MFLKLDLCICLFPFGFAPPTEPTTSAILDTVPLSSTYESECLLAALRGSRPDVSLAAVCNAATICPLLRGVQRLRLTFN